MVGGKVVHKVEFRDWVSVTVRGTGTESHSYRSFEMVGEHSWDVALGDTLWEQGRYLYWTPADGSGRVDVKISRRLRSTLWIRVTRGGE